METIEEISILFDLLLKKLVIEVGQPYMIYEYKTNFCGIGLDILKMEMHPLNK